RPVVFFMAMARIGKLVENLLKRGRLSSEPAAVVWGASTPSQEIVRGTLGNIEALVKNRDRELPGLFIVGETTSFSLANMWSAFNGERILLLSPPNLWSQLEAEILAYGGQPVIPPLALALEGVNLKKPEYDTVLIVDEKNVDNYTALWGEIESTSIFRDADAKKMIRKLALERVREKLG
ncbi:MAG: hypothetical protein J7M09_06755, partial [Deltaproteobacteria bacterium]|nr:hypothetical protein [Candidatus Tharpella sp.]